MMSKQGGLVLLKEISITDMFYWNPTKNIMNESTEENLGLWIRFLLRWGEFFKVMIC